MSTYDTADVPLDDLRDAMNHLLKAIAALEAAGMEVTLKGNKKGRRTRLAFSHWANLEAVVKKPEPKFIVVVPD